MKRSTHSSHSAEASEAGSRAGSQRMKALSGDAGFHAVAQEERRATPVTSQSVKVDSEER